MKVPINKLTDTINKELEALVRGASNSLAMRAIDKAPTLTGALKGSITAGLNSIPSQVSNIDPNGSQTKNSIEQILTNYKSGDIIYISATADYAEEIEMGNSEKAPQGFMRPAAEEIDSAMREAAQNIQRYRK